MDILKGTNTRIDLTINLEDKTWADVKLLAIAIKNSNNIDYFEHDFEFNETPAYVSPIDVSNIAINKVTIVWDTTRRVILTGTESTIEVKTIFTDETSIALQLPNILKVVKSYTPTIL